MARMKEWHEYQKNSCHSPIRVIRDSFIAIRC